MVKKVRQPDVVDPSVLNRVSVKDIPDIRERLIKSQKGYCALCKNALGNNKRPALDHDHKTGFIRDVLCINCNGMEGKIFSLARRAGGVGNESYWLVSLLAYYKRHAEPKHGGLIHPTHKTADEKRIALNKKARMKRKNNAIPKV